jgi:N-acetyl-1-D-myo-inositol-2-amino-2-deoxy-alpha-D-glucopyranoside deacetylase
MAGTPSAEHPRALVRGSVAEQARQLSAVLDEVRPQVVVSYDAHGGYGHPDHVRAHEITMAAAQQADSVVRVFHTVSSAAATARGLAALRRAGGVPFRIPGDDELPTVPDERITTRIDIAAALPAKFAALRAHRTQVSVAAGCFALSNGIAQPVADTEFFVLARGPEHGAETDLFGGLPR